MKRFPPPPHYGGMDARRYLAVFILFLLAAMVAAAQAPDDPLTDVKRLYASASYEDALAALGRVGGQADANQIDEYRALCYLGLNRPQDAEQVVERLVMRNGSSSYDFNDASPKFVTLYRAVKKRTLPLAATALYVSAKTSFENAQFAPAAAQFKELLVLLSDPEAAATLGDLKLLAEGFSRLSDQRLADVTPPAHQPPPAAVAVEASPRTPPRGVYGSDDLDVIPPAIIDQRMPAWIPTGPFLATRVMHGTLEVVVAEDGTVESRMMSEPVFPSVRLGTAQRRAAVEVHARNPRRAPRQVSESDRGHPQRKHKKRLAPQ